MEEKKKFKKKIKKNNSSNMKKNKIKKKNIKNQNSNYKRLNSFKSYKMLKFMKIILIFLLIFIFSYPLYIFTIRFLYLKKNIIPVAFALNNEFTLPLIVTLTSVLYNADKNTFYIVHIMISEDFLEVNKRKIIGLNKKYKNFKIIFLDLKDKYKGWITHRYYDISTYYRLSLSDLVFDFDKIIYLDCDTLVHKDLSEMYNLEMNNYYYMGIPNMEIGLMEINGTRNFIGAGVMLINLKELRRLNATNLFVQYYNAHGTKKVDEYLINVVFCRNIGFLALKFGLPDFHTSLFSVETFYKKFRGHLKMPLEEFIKASKDPSITHNNYTLKKWWTHHFSSLSNIGKKWIFYASKSNILSDVCQEYTKYKEICDLLSQK